LKYGQRPFVLLGTDILWWVWW